MRKRTCTAVLLGTLLASVPAFAQEPAESTARIVLPTSGTTQTGFEVALAQAPALPPASERAPQPLPSSPDRLGGQSIFGEAERLPKVNQGNLMIPPIMAATTDIGKIGNGSAPTPFRTQEDSPSIDLPESANERSANWSPLSYQFAAANTFSHPRYFEDRMLERHGHERFHYLQPMISGAKFFSTFPMLPYLMTVSPPADIEYQLGYFRPGSAVYPYLQRPPYQRDAAIVEGAAIAKGIIVIP